jgi:hypothetical protein
LGLFEGILGFIVTRSWLCHILCNFSHPLNLWVRVKLFSNRSSWRFSVNSRL